MNVGPRFACSANSTAGRSPKNSSALYGPLWHMTLWLVAQYPPGPSRSPPPVNKTAWMRSSTAPAIDTTNEPIENPITAMRFASTSGRLLKYETACITSVSICPPIRCGTPGTSISLSCSLVPSLCSSLRSPSPIMSYVSTIAPARAYSTPVYHEYQLVLSAPWPFTTTIPGILPCTFSGRYTIAGTRSPYSVAYVTRSATTPGSGLKLP